MRTSQRTSSTTLQRSFWTSASTASVNRCPDHPDDESDRPSYAGPMACRAEGFSNDSVLVLTNDEVPEGAFDEWLASLKDGEISPTSLGAAEILRDIRDHGER